MARIKFPHKMYVVEPCILVMYHSMRPHPAITATLLDFMCRVSTDLYQNGMGIKLSLMVSENPIDAKFDIKISSINLNIFASPDYDEFLPTIDPTSENGHVHIFANHPRKTCLSVSMSTNNDCILNLELI